MVPVRKPGRPLSSCPHPSSRPCSCAAVTAAIPRKQKCGCGPSSSTDSDNNTSDRDTASTAVTPPSPSTFGSSAAFRVQKQAGRSGPSRKQSVDLAGLQRMDANQINILPSYGSMSPQQMSAPSVASTPVSDLSLYGPNESTFCADSGVFPVFPYAVQPAVISSGSAAKPISNGKNGLSTNGAIKHSTEVSKSCCGGANDVENQAHHSLGPSRASSVSAKTRSSFKSCCSTKTSPSPQDQKPTLGITPALSMPFPPNGVMMPPFQHPLAMTGGMYPFYSQPNIFNYPPQYGSYLQPLQPEQWRQFMAGMAFAQSGGNPPFGMPGHIPVQHQPQQNPTSPNAGDWTWHQCGCGDTCECVGCAAHPYNEATQNYVRSAWSTMTEDAQKVHAHANGNGSLLNGNGLANAVNGSHAEPEEASHVASDGTTTPNKPGHDESWSPKAAQTPSDAASGVSEEQALSASDFFFVSYPFGESCAGETTSCPCGDDCQCIGCAIHNNPDPSQATSDESRDGPGRPD